MKNHQHPADRVADSLVSEGYARSAVLAVFDSFGVSGDDWPERWTEDDTQALRDDLAVSA